MKVRSCSAPRPDAMLLGGERVLAERLGQGWVNDLRMTVFERVARTPVWTVPDLVDTRS